MRKPKYVAQLMGFIFLCIGVVFVFLGILVAIGVMHPSKHSMVQDSTTMTLIFCMIGTTFCMVNAVLVVVSRKKENQHNELISNNKRVTGKVEEIQYKRGITFGKTSPYVICFSYSLNGENYRGKSCLIWEKPDLTVGDNIEIYVNNVGNSTVMI